MRKTILAFLCGLSLLFAACGELSGSKNQITVKYDGKEHTFEPKTSWTNVNKTNSTSGTSQSIVFEMTNLERKGDRPSAEEQFGVSFRAEGAQGTNETSPVREGAYNSRKDSRDFYNVVHSPYIFYFADGKSQTVKLNADKMKGNVTLTSVTEEAISGTIDITDDKGNAIKGGFTAKREK
jgi:hypothetical protein